jgi:two-component system CheB/CheR fusion protein
MDIVSCRNMLIYFEPVLQQRILTLIHYALKPRGYLVLGHSESLGGFRDLFSPVDVKHKIFEKRASARGESPMILGPSHAPAPIERETTAPAEMPAASPEAMKAMDRILISRYAPAAVLVSAELEILQVRGDTGPYLSQPSGRASLNILKMAREGLLVALRSSIDKARRDNTTVREYGIPVKSGQDFKPVNLEVMPIRLGARQEGACLVMFEEGRQRTDDAPAEPGDVAGLAREELVERLTQELFATREYLQSVIEQQEAANEELQSANEESQSSNEELQSINEELETSKEEIQSANEELATVNEELYERNQELGRVNNDLVNLLASMETAVIMVGPDLRIRRFTPVAQRVFNLIAADIGRPISDIQLSLSVENLDVLLMEAIDTVKVCEREVDDREGRRCLLRIRPYRTLENKIDGAVIMVFDAETFGERNMGDDLGARRSEVLLVLEADLRVRSASQAFYSLFETTLSETERQPLASLCDGQWDVPGLAEKLQTVIARNEPFEDFEFEFDFGQRGRRSLRLSARRLSMRGAGGPQAVLVIEDVTDQRRLKASLAEIARMTEAERQRDEFLAMIAHELRNPMAAIQNASGLLSNPAIAEAMKERINKILGRQVRGLARLVEDLLDTARITHGKIELKTELQELGPLVESQVESVRANAKAREQSLELTLPPYALYVEADAERLGQVLSNLLNNACKFTPPGGAIWVSVSFESDTALLRVRDNGDGIPPELLPKIFDLFMQADNTLGRVQGGLGIGLTVARRLVQMHGGTLEATSEGAGKGSEFIVRLPARRLREAPPAKASRKRKAAGSCRVLVVDDNADAAEMLATALQLEGHVVEIESHSVNALPAAMKMKPDAIVLDIGMPELDGYELARRLRKEPSTASTLLIALTGYGKEGDRARAFEAGFDEHVVKPADPDELAGLIASGTSGRRPAPKSRKK